MRTKLFFFVLLSLILSPVAYAQECQACKTRVIILYDNEVTVPRPYADKDSVYRYWDYFFIAGGVKDYIMNTDPTSNCLTKLDGAFFTVPDTFTSNISWGIEQANIPPAGSAPGAADYIIHGTVSGGASQSFTLQLEAGKTRELVKSGVISLPAGFDPFERGKTVAAFIGPIYTSILNFEKKKRDEGEPYAIQPKVTLTPAKKKLNVNEQTTIEVLFMDCDDVPLKNRTLTFTSDAGVLKSAEVTTDDQGKGTLEFTAGPQADIANITTVYPFMKATGDMDGAEVVPAVIQIEKPNGSWFVYGNYKMENTNTLERSYSNGPISDVASGRDRDWTDIEYSAWVQNINSQPNYFTSDPANYTITYFGSFGEYSYYRANKSVKGAGYSIENNYYVGNAIASRGTLPKPDIRILSNSYAFSIGNMTAPQNGGGQEVLKWFNPTLEPPSGTTTTVIKADPETILRLSVQGPKNDTIYQTIETVNTGDGTIITRDYVQQKFSWKDNVCTLNYQNSHSEDTQIPGLGTVTKWDQTYTVQFHLSYAGDPPSAVKIPAQQIPILFELLQNYPNPFNPVTTIEYRLPNAEYVVMTVSDIVGRTIATLVDKEQDAGRYAVMFDASKLASGIYFYTVRAGKFSATKKLSLVK